jgi:hypothetical protein
MEVVGLTNSNLYFPAQSVSRKALNGIGPYAKSREAPHPFCSLNLQEQPHLQIHVLATIDQ